MSDVEADPTAGERAADEQDDGAVAPTATAVLEYLVKALVDEPDGVEVDAIEGGRGISLEVRVAPGDLGRVIGKRGRTANAIRTVTRAAAVRDDARVDIEFLE